MLAMMAMKMRVLSADALRQSLAGLCGAALFAVLLVAVASVASAAGDSVTCPRGYESFNGKTCPGLSKLALLTSYECSNLCSRYRACAVWVFADNTCYWGYCSGPFEELPDGSVGCKQVPPRALATQQSVFMLPFIPTQLASFTYKKSTHLVLINETSLASIEFNEKSLLLLSNNTATMLSPHGLLPGAAVVSFGDERLAMIGGRNGSDVVNAVSIYFGSNNTWTELTSVTGLPPMMHLQAVTIQNGSLVAGFGYLDGELSAEGAQAMTLWRSDDGGVSWHSLDCPVNHTLWPVEGKATLAAADGLVVVAGGIRSGNKSSDVVWALDADGTWAVAGYLVAPTESPIILSLTQELLLVSNGDGADVWLLNFAYNDSAMLTFSNGLAPWSSLVEPAVATSLIPGAGVVADPSDGSAWLVTMREMPPQPIQPTVNWAKQHAFAIVVGLVCICLTVAATVLFFVPHRRKKKAANRERELLIKK